MEQHVHQALGEPNNERTILDYLNEDCWREILKYVHVRDIIRTESTSREWQRVVLRYLSTTHIRVRQIDPWLNKGMDVHKFHNCLYMSKEDISLFECWSRKLGHAVVAFKKYGGGVKEYMVLKNNCPNLEVLELEHFAWLQKQEFSPSEVFFPHLKRLRITSRSGLQSATDGCITSFITSQNLEQLEIFINNEVTGLCLTNIRSIKLKSLVFRRCRNFALESLVSIADRLGGLTKFVLTRCRRRMHDQFHLILDKMPKLEHLTIQIIDAAYFKEKEHDSNVFYKAVCRLVYLRHLSSNFAVWDRHLEQITECCKKLKTLKLVCEVVTAQGTNAIYRNIGENLECLDLQYTHDEDYRIYVTTINACPKLTCLRVDAVVVKHDITELAEAWRQMHSNQRLQVISEFNEDDDPCNNYDSDPCDHIEVADVFDLVCSTYYYDSDGLSDSDGVTDSDGVSDTDYNDF